MTVMARILASGGFQQPMTEKAGRQKLVCQHIQKQLHEADDANLIDEEDMHVFDLRPMTDQLHLVCCNSCKKPVKTSQFVAHAERCSSLGIAVEVLRNPDSGAPKRKPPRKERKKIAGNHVTSAGTEERFAIVDASESAVSTSQLEHVELISSCFEEAKDTPWKISGSVSDMIPLTKRPKLLAPTVAQASGDIRIAPDAPAPLVTKTYYPQRNNRLKAAITYMYHQASAGEREDSQRNLITWGAHSKAFSDELSDDRSKKKHLCSSPIAQNLDQFIQSAEASLVNTECQPCNGSMDQFLITDSDTYTSQVASFGARTTMFQSRPYSSTGNSGKMTTLKQNPAG